MDTNDSSKKKKHKKHKKHKKSSKSSKIEKTKKHKKHKKKQRQDSESSSRIVIVTDKIAVDTTPKIIETPKPPKPIETIKIVENVKIIENIVVPKAIEKSNGHSDETKEIKKKPKIPTDPTKLVEIITKSLDPKNGPSMEIVSSESESEG